MPTLKKAPLGLIICLGLLCSASPAFAETHPFTNISFGRSATETFSNPNGIAVDESTGDVYVTDLGTNTVSKFDSSGTLIESWGTKGVLDGSTVCVPHGETWQPCGDRRR